MHEVWDFDGLRHKISLKNHRFAIDSQFKGHPVTESYPVTACLFGCNCSSSGNIDCRFEYLNMYYSQAVGISMFKELLMFCSIFFSMQTGMMEGSKFNSLSNINNMSPIRTALVCLVTSRAESAHIFKTFDLFLSPYIHSHIFRNLQLSLYSYASNHICVNVINCIVRHAPISLGAKESSPWKMYLFRITVAMLKKYLLNMP